mgnify:CR=1 FL=1
MTKEIDARGLSCPAPVLLARDAVENEGQESVLIIVDNDAAKHNVRRFLESQDFNVSVNQIRGDFYVTGNLSQTDSPEVLKKENLQKNKESKIKKTMVMVTSDCIGHGDDELGFKLMVSFLKTLNEMGKELWRLVFVNNGVKLTVDNSEVLPVLKNLEEKGVYILVCGTCLTHFNLLENKQVGETTNMLDIVTAMQLADKLISI